MLAEKLSMSYDEAERWIVNLVRNAKLDAKIDSESGTVVMAPNHLNVYEQIIENTKQLSLRTSVLAKNLIESATAAQSARVQHIHVDTCSDRSTDLYRPSETHFDWASVDTYSDSSTDLCCLSEEYFDWTLSK
ncbi:hypothetical protein QJS10_CPB17g01733 [Acorus calamus]|uniref:PCI domain-containing protein n=1 Tax=Acorus calamus TaxID=4465 RepID=A0AAV9CUJ4_ACOCL|nr:hypothetical protein QJS10_CPB17g01733 [Acorus calamus]